MRRRFAVVVAVLTLGAVLAVGGPSTPVAAATCNIKTPSSTYAQPVAWSAGHAQVWRLYQAFFLRQPDYDGFAYWQRARAQGTSLSTIAYTFANGPEFKARYGSLNDSQFVDLVYRNVLCRAPDAGGKSYWVGQLRSGLKRWDMVINFAELREYLTRTRTCHSIYDAETRAVSTCPYAKLRPLSQATLATDGYQAKNATVGRVGGGSGSFRAVEVVFSRNVFETGHNRCSIASINGNWTVAAQKDQPNPSALGLGVVDGMPVKGSSDRTDRGVIGLRFDPSPKNVVEVWPGDTLSPDDTRLSSVMYHQGVVSAENWHAAAEISPYLNQLAPQEKVAASEWVWAAAGVPLLIDGQPDEDFMSDYNNDPYTYKTLNHSFVAFDQNTGRLVFGATSSLDVRDLLVWFQANGYEDLVKFDGGGSTEFNINRQAVVAGTSRDLPVWLGIGC